MNFLIKDCFIQTYDSYDRIAECQVALSALRLPSGRAGFDHSHTFANGSRRVTMGQFVIVAYRPKESPDTLLNLLREHLPLLRAEGLATERPGMVMRSASGAIVEVFEWCSAAAVEAAHANVKVQELWKRFELVSEYVPLANLPECQHNFAELEAIDL
jgi:hypothetical protein